jgi:uncharacterized protein YdeI (YjbR/CyaY-like superfamily)
VSFVPTGVIYFETAAELRAWLGANAESAHELWIGYYKKSTGRPSITHAEAVDEALCYGWIDGIRKSVDADSYANRFTPRRPDSNWSRINIKRVGELMAQGRMQPAGLTAFEQRDQARATISSADEHVQQFDAASEQQFQANEAAWAFFEAQPPGYRRLTIAWVMSPKGEAARARRLAAVIEDSAAGRRSTWTLKGPTSEQM